MSANQEYELSEILRRIENMQRFGTIAELDLEIAKARVQYDTDENGDPVLTGWIKWTVKFASANNEWNPPKIGEQVLFLSPSGNMSIAVIVARLNQTAHPAKSNSSTLIQQEFSDGAIFQYDTDTHQLDFILPDGGKINFVAPAGISMQGDTELDGNFKATGEVEDSIGALDRLRQNYNTAQYIGNLGGLTSPTNKVDAA